MLRQGLLRTTASRSESLVARIEQQRRGNFQAILRRKLDRQTGTYKFEDWDTVMRGFHEPQLTSGQTLRDRDWRNDEHVKPTELKRQLKSAKVYRSKVKQIDDLIDYVQFINKYDKSS